MISTDHTLRLPGFRAGGIFEEQCEQKDTTLFFLRNRAGPFSLRPGLFLL
jgi:hypothetical protein